MKRKDEKLIRLLTRKQAANVLRLSVGQLRAWERNDIYHPACAGDSKTRNSTAYDFKDLVNLKVIATLKNEHKVPISGLKDAAAWLARQGRKDWPQMRVYVFEKQVHFVNNDAEVEGVSNGQLAFHLADIIAQVEKDIAQLGDRAEGQIGKIVKKRGVLASAEVLDGTRIPVFALRDFINQGYTNDEIVRQYPSLTKEDIEAVRQHIAA